MVNWTDKCHKCGVNIFNGIPENEDISKYIEKKKQEGWIMGYKEKPVGSFGNMHNVSIKPICTICSQKESLLKDSKEKKKAIQKIGKLVKKEFTCPCCFRLVEKGYNTKVFKSFSKKDIITHVNGKHTTKEMKEILPYDGSD